MPSPRSQRHRNDIHRIYIRAFRFCVYREIICVRHDNDSCARQMSILTKRLVHLREINPRCSTKLSAWRIYWNSRNGNRDVRALIIMSLVRASRLHSRYKFNRDYVYIVIFVFIIILFMHYYYRDVYFQKFSEISFIHGKIM